jgi:glycosyltransferase involved in cell wall biosynthesis
MPFFSVVIAAFNAASWIVPTVRSALNQSYRDFEIIIIGDGCTDTTGDVLMSNFGNSIQWRNLDKNYGGQSLPNNEGIRISRGTYIAYLGHDDIWSPHHLERLSEVIHAQEPDFAVSGLVCHSPPGCRHYHITGIFDDPATAKVEFFPPSSFAHRRTIVETIGWWRDPTLLRAPADCDFLLRAVAHECAFASTKTITAHKFAAGHRYLSYRCPSDLEQVRLLALLSEEGGEARILREIERDIAEGADNVPLRYFDFDDYRPGDIYRKIRGTKGLEIAPPVPVTTRRWLPVDAFPAGLDWYDLEERFPLEAFRWSGPNPNARYLLNVRVAAAIQLKIHVLAFAGSELVEALALDVDGKDVAFVRDRNAAGAYILTVERINGPIENGLVLRFKLPHCVRLQNDPLHRRAGLALSGMEVAPVL